MKHLILAVLLFAACSKPNITTYDTKKVFYKLQEVDKDGKTTDSPIRYTDVTIANKNGDEGGGGHHDHEGDDDDDDDDDNHNPLTIKIETFVVKKINSNTIRIYWEATDEDNVNHYNILKSFDAENWDKMVEIVKDSGKYEYIDKF